MADRWSEWGPVHDPLDLLRSVARTGTTVVMATHDPAAINYVDRALIVRDGTCTLPIGGN